MHKVRSTILLVEDDPASRNLVRAILKFRGYRIAEVDTLKGAREFLKDNIPGIILLDIRLKDGSGMDLAKEIRADAQFDSVPVVAITAQALMGDEEKILAAGVDFYLSKPINTHKLRDLVDKFTQQGRGAAGHEH